MKKDFLNACLEITLYTRFLPLLFLCFLLFCL